MQFFRNLAKKVVFKIFLSFVALTFVLFGVSSFFLGNPNSWVAKVGDDNINYSQFNAALRADREIILASSNNSEKAVQYLESDAFKTDVLGRLVNKVMVKKLADDFDVSASKKIILESIVKDPSFKNDAGKFDKELFAEFLKKNGLNEERYLDEIASSAAATMILKSFSLAAPVSDDIVARMADFNQEKRFADVLTISSKNLGRIAQPTAEELQEFYEENQVSYVTPESRKVSYLTFSRKDFAKDLRISNEDVFAEYEKGKEEYTKPETRSFYHVVFDEKIAAEDFLKKFTEAKKAGKSNAKSEFRKLAKELAQKNLNEITLSKISQRDMIPQISGEIFQLSLDENSQVLSSPLGFHVFLLNAVGQPELIPFSEVKNGIKEKMAEGREEKVLQEKISEIDDLLLTSNSISEVAKKFGLKISKKSVIIDANGNDEKGREVAKVKAIQDFAVNAFNLEKNQTSKIFYSQDPEAFYALVVEDIFPPKQLTLKEVKKKVRADLLVTKKKEATSELATKIGKELKEKPNSISAIARKYHVKLDRNREFPRVFLLSFQGQQLPYQDQFLKDLFAADIGQATSVSPQSDDQFVVGVLRKINKADLNSAQLKEARKKARVAFGDEVMKEYNSYLLGLYPVETNDKVFSTKQGE